MLGKPVDLREARSMLALLAGRDHHVHTAVALCGVSRGIETVAVASATVRMKPYREQAIAQYLRTNEPLGKAGGYSIQGEGGTLIDRVEGDYTAVVGLPLRLVAELLAAAGHPVSVDLDALYRAKPYPNWAAFAPD
jgi:septum formation protein